MYRINSRLFALYLIVFSIRWVIPLYMFSVVGKVVSTRSVMYQDVSALSLLIVSGVLSSFGAAYVQKRIFLHFGDWAKSSFEDKLVGSDRHSNVLFRNIELFLDSYIESLDFLLRLAAIFITLVTYAFIFGAWSSLIIVSMGLFLPLIKHLVRKADYFYRHVQKITDMRTDTLSRLINHRDMIQSLSLEKSFRMKLLERLLNKETLVRNFDSLYRCLEIYIETFGKILPFVLFIIFSRLYSPEYTEKISEVFWVSLPLISALFILPRGITCLRTVKRSSGVLNSFFSEASIESNTIVADGKWDTWRGQLSDNILADSSDYLNMVTATNLLDELGENRILEAHGANISAGQKSRVLFARALGFGLELGKKVRIDLNFDSLDDKNKERVLSLIKSYSDKVSIELSSVAKNTLAHRSKVSPNPIASSAEVKTERPKKDVVILPNAAEVARSLVKRCRLLFPLFLVAAGMNSLLYSLVSKIHDSYTYYYGIGLIVLGPALATFTGYLLERTIRKNANAALLAGLKNKFLNFGKLQKIAFVEYNNVIERLAFYVHDLGWIFALYIMSFITIIVSAKLYGVLPAIVITMALSTLYIKLMPLLHRARTQYVHCSQKFLSRLNDLAIIDKMETLPTTSLLRRKLLRNLVNPALKSWLDKKFLLHFWKSVLSTLGKASIHVIFVIMIIIFDKLGTPAEIRAIVFGSLFSIESESTRLFAAFSGYTIQLQAERSLAEGATIKGKGPANFEVSDMGMILPELESLNTYKKMKNLKLEFGLFKIHADSGQGKSSYFKTLLKHSYMTDRVKVAYLPQDLNKSLRWIEGQGGGCRFGLLQLCERLKSEGFNLFFFDETLLGEPIQKSERIYEQLAGWCISNQVLGLCADHRISCIPTINLQDLVDA